MLNSISKTVAYATQLVPQLDIVNPSKILFTMPSTLMNIIYVMPKSVSFTLIRLDLEKIDKPIHKTKMAEMPKEPMQKLKHSNQFA